MAPTKILCQVEKKVLRHAYDGSKERLDALNAPQKTSALCTVLGFVLSRKTDNLVVFFVIFWGMVSHKVVGFFALPSVHQGAYFRLSKTSLG